jgi:GTP-binding protein YchF
MLADLQSTATMKDKAARTARSGDKDAKRRLELLEQCNALLEDGRPVRGLMGQDPALDREIESLQLLTSKRVLYVANIEESDLAGQGEMVQKVREHAAAEGGQVVPVCAALEAELAELDGEDRDAMLHEVGLAEPALAVLARAAYQILGLQSYFTAGEKEVRAWTIPAGATAPQAAGVIHSDFERGFIRVEVYSVDDLVELKSEKAIREAGKLRVEGKQYIMKDGDVCHFLFNV